MCKGFVTTLSDNTTSDSTHLGLSSTEAHAYQCTISISYASATRFGTWETKGRSHLPISLLASPSWEAQSRFRLKFYHMWEPNGRIYSASTVNVSHYKHANHRLLDKGYTWHSCCTRIARQRDILLVTDPAIHSDPTVVQTCTMEIYIWMCVSFYSYRLQHVAQSRCFRKWYLYWPCFPHQTISHLPILFVLNAHTFQRHSRPDGHILTPNAVRRACALHTYT